MASIRFFRRIAREIARLNTRFERVAAVGGAQNVSSTGVMNPVDTRVVADEIRATTPSGSSTAPTRRDDVGSS
jgi:hypothetical protein